MPSRFIRLDTLEPVKPPVVLWGAEGRAVRVKRFALFTVSAQGRVPFLPVSANWAVRLVAESPQNARLARLAYLIARDGSTCFYCGNEIDPATVTIEHVVPKSCGGPDHASNLILACPCCNPAVGHMSVAEKFRYALERRTR